ncbi:MAG: hypothetical protein PF693_18310 [Spirochaetia bacterium]|jgi:hypothetical protein|nr:hypothetical protein [Spirochaetia bacterium]
MTRIDLLQSESVQSSSEPLLEAIRDLFSSYFDHPWLINIIDELPENMGNMGSIRTFLALSSIHPIQESIVLNGLTGLKTMVRIINIWLIPESTDIFGVSPFTKKRVLSNRRFRKCIAYTLPANTMNLSMLIEEFEKEISESEILGIILIIFLIHIATIKPLIS